MNVRATTLEPIMRVAFSKSGTSQVTNSHASTVNVQKNNTCANHTNNKEHCCISGVNVSGNWFLRSRRLENGSVKTDLCKDNTRESDLQSLWHASSDMSELASCCCIAVIACGIGLFHMARSSSRLTSVHVNTSQNNSGCEVLQRVYRHAGRSHMLKMRKCVHITLLDWRLVVSSRVLSSCELGSSSLWWNRQEMKWSILWALSVHSKSLVWPYWLCQQIRIGELVRFFLCHESVIEGKRGGHFPSSSLSSNPIRCCAPTPRPSTHAGHPRL